MTTRSVSVVLPCLNEADSVGDVVREAAAALASAGASGEVLVVDNGSTDSSAEVARAAGARVVHERRRGYGAAYLAGFRAATGDVIVMADADNTYDLSALPAFLARIGGGDDLVMGSRFKGHMEAGAMPALHRFGSPILSGLLNVLYGTGVDDAHCGMRAFKREALERMQLRMQGMEFASEMIVNAARAGLCIGEVPVNYRVRSRPGRCASRATTSTSISWCLAYSSRWSGSRPSRSASTRRHSPSPFASSRSIGPSVHSSTRSRPSAASSLARSSSSWDSRSTLRSPRSGFLRDSDR